MNVTESTLPTTGPGPFDRLLERAVVGRLSRLPEGRIVLQSGDGQRLLGDGSGDIPPVDLEVVDGEFYRRIALGGSIGAGESYMLGQWRTSNLTDLVRLLARNLDVVEAMEGGFARLARAVSRALHLARRNTRRGSRRNIARHYDLGNDFFQLFLDPTMMYSCAVFPYENSSLEEASIHKLELICRKLDLKAGDEVIEIGTGWGGFACHAAREHGCRVVTTTVSRRQYEYARERVRSEGLEGSVDVILCDYRDLRGHLRQRFDKLVSIEMIEAVGHEFLPTYFEICADLLRPHGAALIQAITIPDERYDRYRRSVDFIQKYIFPGGLLPSMGVMTEAIDRRTDLTLHHFEDISAHYRPDAALLARALPCQSRPDPRARPARGLPTDVGVLPLLLRSRLPRAGDRRRPAPSDQARLRALADRRDDLPRPLTLDTPNRRSPP